MSILAPAFDEHDHAFVPLPIVDPRFRMLCECGRMLNIEITKRFSEEDISKEDAAAMLRVVKEQQETMKSFYKSIGPLMGQK